MQKPGLISYLNIENGDKDAFRDVLMAHINSTNKTSLVKKLVLVVVDLASIFRTYNHIIGIDTDACVLYSAIGFFDNGRKVKVFNSLYW